MKTALELEQQLMMANAKAVSLAEASVRSGKGPSDEYKAAFRAARMLWRQWSDAQDIEAGRKPAFASMGGAS